MAASLLPELALKKRGDMPCQAIDDWTDADEELACHSARLLDDRYPGLSVSLLKLHPAFDTALGLCEEVALKELNVPAPHSAELGGSLSVLSRIGFSVAAAQALGRAVRYLLEDRPDEVPADLGRHILALAKGLSRSAAHEAVWGRLGDLAEVLARHPDEGLAKQAAEEQPHIAAGLAQTRSAPAQASWLICQDRAVEAVELLAREAERGDIECMYRLATLREIGLGCKEDSKAQKRLLSKACAAGHKGALGECLIEGLGMKKDVARGRALLTECAESGNDWAQGSLGSYILQGLVGPKDEAQARLWILRAVVARHPLALLVASKLGWLE